MQFGLANACGYRYQWRLCENREVGDAREAPMGRDEVGGQVAAESARTGEMSPRTNQQPPESAAQLESPIVPTKSDRPDKSATAACNQVRAGRQARGRERRNR